MPRQTCDTNDGSGERAAGSANGHRDPPVGERLRNPPRPIEWRHVLCESRCVTTNDPAADIRSVIRRIDSAWREGPADEIVARLMPLFDPDVVFCRENFQPVARGASVCAASYESFVRMATVREFSAPDPDIHVAGDTAMAVCPWTMTYTLNDQTYTESGHSLMVFNRAGGQWRVMWRAMVPTAS